MRRIHAVWRLAGGLFCQALILLSTAQAADKLLRIQPIQVCSDDGTVCANVNRTLFSAEAAKIWGQAGMKIEFLPWVTFRGTPWLDLTTSIFDNYTIFTLAGTAGHGQNSDYTVINAWFVRSISGAYGNSLQTVPGLVQRNGVAIADNSFSYGSGGRIDVIAHELGHNLGLDHATFGALGSTNLMVDGRSVPAQIGDITPDGLQLDHLDPDQINQARSTMFAVPITAPVIRTQPLSQIAQWKGSLTFGVTADGAAPLSYQWFFNATNRVLAATNSTLLLTNIQDRDAGLYSVSVSNASGKSTSSNALLLVNHPPVPASPVAERFAGTGVRIPQTALLGTDPEGDPVSLTALDLMSARGVLVTTSEGWVCYLPPTELTDPDTFGYTVGDGRGGSGVGTVAVIVAPGQAPSLTVSWQGPTHGTVRITGAGIAGKGYAFEFTESVSPTSWQPLGTAVADVYGVFEYADTPPEDTPTRFYHVVSD
jgi:hypothetical protein